jgi:hypothetical protein
MTAEVLSRLLSGKKGTRLVLARDAAGLRLGQRVKAAGDFYEVQGRILRTGDVVLAPWKT